MKVLVDLVSDGGLLLLEGHYLLHPEMWEGQKDSLQPL